MSAVTNIPEPPAMPVMGPAHAPAEFRRRIGTISHQSAVYFAGTALTAGAAYFFKIFLARALGAEALGLYALGMSVVGFLGLFNALGLPPAAARFVSQYKSLRQFPRLGEFLRASLGVLCAGNLLMGSAMLLLGPWIARHFYHIGLSRSYFFFFALIMLAGVLSTFLGQVMAGYQDVARRTLITHFIGTPATMLFAVLLISLGLGLRGYLAAQAVSGSLVVILLAVVVWKMTPLPARSAAGFGRVEKEVVTFSAAAFGIAAIEFALSQADKVVLGHYLDPAQVGIYAVASALVAFMPIALQAVNQIFSPMIAELHATGNHLLLQKLYSTLTKWILIFTLPLALAMVSCARPLMAIFGRGFEAGVAVLIIGAAGQLFNCGVGSVGFLLQMSGHQYQLVKIEACNAVLLILLSVLLVPRLGIAGAAAASGIAVIATNVWSLIAVRRRLNLFPYNAGYAKLAPAILVSSFALFMLIGHAGLTHSPFVTAAFGLVCAYSSFMITLWCFGLEADDRRFAQLAWSRLPAILRRK